jgi:glycosyltransferase involved in cell wall biosynthesis
MPRVAVVASHPIQYQAPWFRALATQVDLRVFFCHRQTAEGQARAGFGVAFDWDVPLVDGYPHEWLDNVAPSPGVEKFGGCDTPGIRAALAAGRFDACIVNGWYLKSYLQAIRACRALGIPVLVRGDSQLSRDPRVWKSVVKYFPYRWFLRSIDAHLYVGTNNRHYLEHYGVTPAQLFFVPHFVENDRFAAAAAAADASGRARALRDAWSANEQTIVFLFAGKLIEKKRPADLIDALAIAREGDAHLAAAFVGAGPLETTLRARAAAAGLPIAFAGFQNQQAIADFYTAADCLVLPSDGRETWGLVVNEAMACGRPAIVSDEVGCAPDLVEPGVTGFTYPVGDAPALAARMVEIAALLRRERPAVREAVSTKIAKYSCEVATRVTVEAVSVLTHAGLARTVGAGGVVHGASVSKP